MDDEEGQRKGVSADSKDRQTGRWPNRSHCRGLKVTAAAETVMRTRTKEKKARLRPTSQTFQLALAVATMAMEAMAALEVVIAAVVAMAASRVLDCEDHGLGPG